MIEVESQLRKWGRSMGVVIPKDAVIHEDLKTGDRIELLILKKSNALKETFNTLKFKRSTDEILKEVDEEGWNE
ncbi:MAG: AbrB/MazE/SpoVT family DNA-binding domain-containing protein [Candidatus Woesearchaeota archaeon]